MLPDREDLFCAFPLVDPEQEALKQHEPWVLTCSRVGMCTSSYQASQLSLLIPVRRGRGSGEPFPSASSSQSE